MSAVGGILHLDGRPVDPGALERMGHLLDAYGPDRGRAWREGDAALLHRLRRITPEDARDRQPLTGGEGRWVVSADVRLDNREELTRRLGLSRAWAPRLSDAALLVHAWEQWEEAAPERLLGDFAFAVWDRRERRLHLVRDPSGRRPLYWHRRGGLIAFASVPKGLFALPEIPRGIDEQRFAEYLALMPPFDEGSLLEGVQRVLPAHRLELDERGEANHRYHRFDPERRIVYRREEEYVEHARELLDEAVRCRLRAEGPIAAHLSSGLDSASVTATAARLLGERELLAYTAVPRPGFDGPVPRGRHADEGPGAAAVAARFTNIRHIRLSTEGASPLDQLAESTEGYGLGAAVRTPTNHLWADAIFKDAADRGARVLLTGIAGNKTLSYHGRHRLAGLVGSGELLRWVREAAALRRSGEMRWPRLLATSFGPWLPRGWIRRAVELGGEKSFALLENSPIHPELLRRTGVVKKIGHTGFGLGHHLNSDGRGRRLALFSNRGGWDLSPYIVGAFGIEKRDPLGDLRLIEYCLAIPEEQFLKEGVSRRLMKRMMAGVLPEAILSPATSGLQAADWYEGLRGSREQAAAALERLEASPEARRLLDVEALRQLLERWPEEGWERPHIRRAYQNKLLRGLSAGALLLHIYPGNR